MKLDLNCDLGEGEPIARTRALMRWITSANIACGGHAGDARSMQACVKLACRQGVRVGAHPGSWDRADRGRRSIRITPAELELLLLQQVSALEKIAGFEGTRLHHVKLHGALYHAVERDFDLAKAYVRCLATHWSGLKVYALAGGAVLQAARDGGIQCLAEAFADRGYRPDGTLVPRDQPGALLGTVAAASTRLRDLLRGHGLVAIDGTRIAASIDTLCVHSDSPDALATVRHLSRQLR